MKEYKYYFFDLFHTLIKVKPYNDEKQREYNILGISQQEWSRIAEFDYNKRALGFIKNPDEIIEIILSQMQSSISKEQALLVYEIRKKRFEKAFVEIDESILSTIKILKNNGKVIVLVSNADVFDKLYWKESPLFRYFDNAIFSCDIGVMKPEKEIYLMAKNSVNANISTSVFIGDGAHEELIGAKSIGFDTVLTTDIIQSYWPEEIPRLSQKADYVISQLSELTSWHSKNTGF